MTTICNKEQTDKEQIDEDKKENIEEETIVYDNVTKKVFVRKIQTYEKISDSFIHVSFEKFGGKCVASNKFIIGDTVVIFLGDSVIPKKIVGSDEPFIFRKNTIVIDEKSYENDYMIYDIDDINTKLGISLVYDFGDMSKLIPGLGKVVPKNEKIVYEQKNTSFPSWMEKTDQDQYNSQKFLRGSNIDPTTKISIQKKMDGASVSICYIKTNDMQKFIVCSRNNEIIPCKESSVFFECFDYDNMKNAIEKANLFNISFQFEALSSKTGIPIFIKDPSDGIIKKTKNNPHQLKKPILVLFDAQNVGINNDKLYRGQKVSRKELEQLSSKLGFFQSIYNVENKEKDIELKVYTPALIDELFNGTIKEFVDKFNLSADGEYSGDIIKKALTFLMNSIKEENNRNFTYSEGIVVKYDGDLKYEQSRDSFKIVFSKGELLVNKK